MLSRGEERTSRSIGLAYQQQRMAPRELRQLREDNAKLKLLVECLDQSIVLRSALASHARKYSLPTLVKTYTASCVARIGELWKRFKI